MATAAACAATADRGGHAHYFHKQYKILKAAAPPPLSPPVSSLKSCDSTSCYRRRCRG
jgi:hypothetical protein